jgi:uncharacterized protein
MPTQRTSGEEAEGQLEEAQLEGHEPGESSEEKAEGREAGAAAEEGKSAGGGKRRGGGRGFAGMDPAKQREIASKGGKAAHAKGTAHEFTSEEAREAGRKGGEAGGGANRGFAGMDPAKQREIASKGGKAAHEKGTAHEFTSEEAREAGRKGGEASGGGRRNR